MRLGADGKGVVERLVFEDRLDMLRGTSPALDSIWRESGMADVKSSIAAAWVAGERRIGAVAVYDSQHGFTPHDLWVLRLVRLGRGPAWQDGGHGSRLRAAA